MNLTPKQLEAEATKLRNQGKGYEAVEVYKKARDAYREINETARAAGCTHMIGVSYKIENDIEKALPAYEDAVREYREAGDVLGPGRVYRDAGIMFEYHDQLDKAEEYLQKSKIALEAVDEGIAPHLSVDSRATKNAELGITLAKIGLVTLRRKIFDSAEQNIMDGLVLIRKSGQVHYEMTALMHLGALYFMTERYDPMLTNLEAALGLIYEHELQDEHTRRLAQIWGLMAHGYLAHQNMMTAKRYATKALEVIAGLSESAQKPLLKDIDAKKLKSELGL